jgi:short subunit dehydrogenase-like uncharacterized protein
MLNAWTEAGSARRESDARLTTSRAEALQLLVKVRDDDNLRRRGSRTRSIPSLPSAQAGSRTDIVMASTELSNYGVLPLRCRRAG